MKYLLLLPFILPAILFAETKFEIAEEILFSNFNNKDDWKELERKMHDHRTLTIELLTPLESAHETSQEILALSEQLTLDMNSSDLYVLNIKSLQNYIIRDFSESFTYDELVELRKLTQQPLYEKLVSYQESLTSKTSEYLKEWQDYNTELANQFGERSKEIGKLQMEILKSKLTEEERKKLK